MKKMLKKNYLRIRSKKVKRNKKQINFYTSLQLTVL